MEGYIKLHRQITEWEWYHDANTFRVFIHLLLNANYADGKWKGIEIKRGQRFTSIASLSKELCLSQKAIRGAIEKLISSKNVACKGANNGTMITICNYDTYQSYPETDWQTEGQANGEQMANGTANKGRQTRINKNKKNKKNNNEELNVDMSIFNFQKSFLALAVEKSILSDWLKIRKTKKAVNTETAFNAILKQIEISGISANECITKCVENSWSGFKAEWLTTKTNANKPRSNMYLAPNQEYTPF